MQHLSLKICKIFILLALALASQTSLEAQGTNYTGLFNSGNFTKTIDLGLPVGTVAASADVSSGGASYTIPIAVPPGTNGVAPQITASYNSLGGNGVLGYGWSLGGLSVISRGQKTIYHDGTANAIDFSANDRFTLDGTRLVVVSGTYGANGATYATESESFATITSYGSTGGGPDYFEVVTKDGVTMEYGKTSDSQFRNQGNTIVLYWRLNKIKYNDGNYMVFEYFNDFYRDSRIQTIRYTGNSNTGLIPYNILQFNYSVRTDINTTYQANASVASRYLLDNITITAEGSAAFKTYTFKYGFNDVNSFLKEVVETGSNGVSLNSTIFKYGDEPADFPMPTSSGAVAGQTIDILSGDFDADGYSDILAATRMMSGNIIYHTEFKIYKRTASNSNFTLAATQPLPTSFTIVDKKDIPNAYNFYTTDFTGDGADDVATVKTTGSGSSRVLNEVRIYKSSSDATNFSTIINVSLPTSFSKINSSGNFIFSGDFNGDGISDLLSMLGHNTNGTYGVHLYFGNGTINLASVTTTGTVNFPVSNWASVDKVHIVDFNGDGKSDLMLIKDGTCEIFTFDNLIARSIYVSGFPTKWHLLFFGDFNGDGKTDILSRTSTTNNSAPWHKAVSTGTGFVETSFTFSRTPQIDQLYYGDKVTISDFNGDGKMDILNGWNDYVGSTATTSKLDLYYSRGDNFFYEQYTYNSTFITSPFPVYDLNGDGRSDIISREGYTNPFYILAIKPFGKELLLEKVKNGVDHTTQLTYKRMTEAGTFYTRGSLTNQPLNNVQLPINLVSELNSQNGIGGNVTVQYAYEEAKLHKEGRGFLGMKKITANNLATGMKMVSENEFNTTYYTAAPFKISTYLASNSTLLNEVTLTNQFVNKDINFQKRFWLRVNSTYENKAFEGQFVSSANTYDAYGNVTYNTTNKNNLETTNTTTVFGTYGTPIPAKPTSVTVANTRSGQSAYSTVTTYGYNTIGQLTSKVDFSGQAQSVTTTYGYNTLGNQNAVTITPSGMTARSSSMIYDSKGRFPTSMTNALSQTSSATYDYKWGKPLTETGINGLTISYVYDAFGRLIQTNLPTSFSITQTYGWDVNASEKTIHYQLTSHPGKPDVKIWYDLLDREKKRQLEGFQNSPPTAQWVTEVKTYDVRGNVATSTTPYKSGETVLTTTNTYDIYNRPYTMANTLGTTTYGYAYASGNLTATVTNPASQVSSKVIDATGKTISATDYGGTLTYTYNSQGNLAEVKQGTTILVASTFDNYGRQTQLSDINAGLTQYGYNALGELTSQTSALSQTTTTQYDLLGRPTTRTGAEGTTTYEYYPTGTAAVNQIKKITGFTGNLEEYTYDTYGRVNTTKYTIDATSYITTFSYNTYGDVTSTIYPSGFTVNNTYDANGYLKTLKNGDNSVTMFTANATNGFNQYTNYTLGNGKTSQNTYYFGIPTQYYTASTQDLNLTWNYQSGNLTTRYDAIKGKTESFTYDNLNRLLTATVSGQSALTVNYATSGNITSKTDVGSYTYHPSKINAVTNVTNTPGNIPTLTQSITYTPFFQPATVSENNYQYTYTYASDYERIKREVKLNGTIINNRYYFGNYEKDGLFPLFNRHIHYISAGEGLVAIVVRENGTDTYYYTYTDHLGSILTATNSAGTVVAEQNFDPWGRKRNTTNWTYTSVQSVPVWLYRGYTGHEDMPEFGLINMNGRLYDPILNRMLSADNEVPSALSTQGYNRYSYAFNNPLLYTDPDGEHPGILIGAIIGGVVNLTVGLIRGEVKNLRDGLFYLGTGAAIGALAGATGGASLAATGLSGASIAGGAVAGAVGGAVGGALTEATNATYQTLIYGAPGRNIGRRALQGFIGGAVSGAVIGGVVGGIQAWRNPAKPNLFSGREVAPGRTRWSFNNSANYDKAEGVVEIGDIIGEWPDGRQFTQVSGNIGETFTEGSFSVFDWTGYPTVGNVPKPTGPFRILEGAEYDTARKLANQTNEALKKAGIFPRGTDIHEIHPVKFGGSPTDLANKIALSRPMHTPYTNWWNNFLRIMKK